MRRSQQWRRWTRHEMATELNTCVDVGWEPQLFWIPCLIYLEWTATGHAKPQRVGTEEHWYWRRMQLRFGHATGIKGVAVEC